jgi:hypothetical protein
MESVKKLSERAPDKFKKELDGFLTNVNLSREQQEKLITLINKLLD